MSKKIIVTHAYLGCDTGCCGHIIEIDDKQFGEFHFDHPDSSKSEDIKNFIKNLVIEEMGEEHCKDIDWDGCEIIDD